MAKSSNLPRSPLAPESFPDAPFVRGVAAATASLGLYKGRTRDDLFIIHFPEGAAAAGVFTTSSTRSADVDWCRAALRDGGGRARVLVVNAGNSNAFTGAAGVAKNEATIAAAAAAAGCAREEVFLAATGVIGEPMEAGRIAEGVRGAWGRLAAPSWESIARAFMTTDTFPKGAGAVCEVEGRPASIAGVAKGSGMIAPNMATTLNYVFTDAALTARAAQALLSRLVDETFNCITVDGDTSTSDTLMLFATGAAGGEPVDDPDDPRLGDFRRSLHGVLQDLAIQIVRDGEGATKLIEITVEGAADHRDARRVAASIANSPLVKTAVAAGDANWGRIVMAVGKSGARVDRDRLAVSIGGLTVARDGARAPDYSEAAATAAVSGPLVYIGVDLGLGEGGARMWTCDLTDGYVAINGAYRS